MAEDILYRAKKSVGPGLADHSAQPDMARMRGYRMQRFQAELKRLDYAGAVLFDPVNIRYATGSRNMAVWTLHNPARYAFVPAEGKAVLFDFHNCEHLSNGIETIGEVRPARAWFFFTSGNRVAEKAKLWAGELVELIKSRCRTNPWFQEASDRVVRPGDLVSFDPDLIGPFGYCADISRTFHCGPGKPSPEQRKIYGLAMEQIHYNIDLVKPGLSLAEFSEKAW